MDKTEECAPEVKFLLTEKREIYQLNLYSGIILERGKVL